MSVFGGELLFGGLISFFYIQQESFYYGITQSINTSLLSSIALILLVTAYFGFGVTLKFQQTIGAFVIIVGSLCMYIALQTHVDSTVEQGQETPVATTILGLNTVTALCFSGVFTVLKLNHQNSQIKWHSGLMAISFVSFLSSAIILVALKCLALLTDHEVKKEIEWSAGTQLT